MKRAALALLVLSLGVALPASAQRDQSALFPRQAAVPVERSGLVRLPVPPDVLRVAQPDFSDVRILGPDGAEAPYIVEAAMHAATDGGRLRAVSVVPVDVQRETSAPRGQPETSVERYEVLVPGPLAAGVRYRLQLEADAPSFVRRVVVTRIEAEAQTELATDTIFRLASPTRERGVIELPALPTGARLAIEISGEGGYLEPRVSFLRTTMPLVPTTVDLPLDEVSSRSADGRTVLVLERPPGVRADRLRFETTRTHFTRAVTVSDGDVELGRGVLFGVPELGLTSMEVDIGPSGGGRITVTLDDGDSPALEELRVVAVVRAPNLVFVGDDGPHRLLYGGHRVRAPRYDLQQAAGPLRARLRGSALPLVEAGEPEDNPDYAAGPALEFAMRPGRVVDEARFTHVAALHVEGAVEGSSRVTIPPRLAAVASSDLRDLRIVDAEGQQWPYLVQRGVETSRLDVTPEVEEGDGETTYVMHVPHGSGHVGAIQLYTDLVYVSRGYQLVGFDVDGRPHALQGGELYRDPVEGSGLLRLEFTATWLARLELTVTDGSEAALDFERVELEVKTSQLFLAAPDGDYRILAGDPEASAPSYEIERARGLVLEASAVDATVGDVEANAAHVAPAWHESAELSSWVVWGVLLFAVFVLGALTFRLAGRDDGDEPPPGGHGEPPAGGGSPEQGGSSGGDDGESGEDDAGEDADPVGDEDSTKAPRPLSF